MLHRPVAELWAEHAPWGLSADERNDADQGSKALRLAQTEVWRQDLARQFDHYRLTHSSAAFELMTADYDPRKIKSQWGKDFVAHVLHGKVYPVAAWEAFVVDVFKSALDGLAVTTQFGKDSIVLCKSFKAALNVYVHVDKKKFCDLNMLLSARQSGHSALEIKFFLARQDAKDLTEVIHLLQLSCADLLIRSRPLPVLHEPAAKLAVFGQIMTYCHLFNAVYPTIEAGLMAWDGNSPLSHQ